MTEFNLNELDADYYLLNFSNDELHEVLIKADEWSEHDVQIARALLRKNGVNIDENVLKQEIEERMANFRKPDKNQTLMVVFGYICAVFGGFLGLLIGYALYATKKELPNGEKIHRYSPENRKSGYTILVISAITCTIMMVLKITICREA